MDVYIKSFNRPYFLDRCIATIIKQAVGYNEIIVLDDGTPEKYLKKIQQKYPHIKIVKSEFYQEKSNMIEQEQIDKKKLKFPGKFWHRECIKSKDFFLLLEDDMFITQPIDLESVDSFMRKNNLFLFKYFWLSSPLMNQGIIEKYGNYELLLAPKKLSLDNFNKIIQNPPFFSRLMNKITGKDYYFKKYMLPYYSYYFVAGAVYSTEYFDRLWQGVENLAEKIQIQRSLSYYQEKKHELKVGKSPQECLKTSFLSSATNEFQGIDFSIFNLNKWLNEAWHKDEFSIWENYPKDYSVSLLLQFIPKEKHEVYKEWIAEFKKPFLTFGCEV